MSENDGTTNDIESPELQAINRHNTILARLDKLADRIDKLENKFTTAQHEHTQVLRTVMVGWNAFLKTAEGQLKILFRGNIPAPILKKLIQTAFKGVDDTDRKGH